ncbi:hypothetical protein [Methylobacterium marchantiae]|uniref:Uncharacterized protein n=1 Tax=Methylobacterium marchantiae TaxID=600331 RepID=A0ABW3WW41_9HYPH|nr:hypothetical protein AIGOOFII_1646 [Methylobacterium marchantiae]
MLSKRFAQVAIGAAALLMLAGGPALAKKVKVVPGDPPITVDIPATWEVSDSKRGIEAKTADEEVYIWFESYKSTQYDKLIIEHEKYFEEQGVTITAKPKQEEKEHPNFVIKKSDFPAPYEGKPTVLRYPSVVPRSEEKRNRLVTYWTSPDGDKEYADELTKIMKSLGASIDEQ